MMQKENLRSKAPFIFSSIALAISILTLLILWKSFLINNRPFIKIMPIPFENTGKPYVIKRVKKNVYEVVFRFQIKNFGSVPANHIQVDHAMETIIGKLPDDAVERVITEDTKEKLKSPFIEGIIPLDLDYDTLDNKTRKFLEEISKKDIKVESRYKKWKTLALLPNESYEYTAVVTVSGSDANWFAKEFTKDMGLQIEAKVAYRGILSNIGRPYYSVYKCVYEKDVLYPFETATY